MTATPSPRGPIRLGALSRSVAWVSSSLMLAQGLRLVQGVIVARWLGPEEMGLNAYLYSILSLLDLLRSVGVEQIYIARSPSEPAAEREWLAGCWNVRLALAGIVGLLMFLGGLGLTAFSGERRLGGLLMMLSLMSPLMNLRSAQLIHQQKVQHFGPLSRFEMTAAVIQAVLPVAVVYFHRSAEALVLANLIAMAIAALLSHVIFPMRFSFGVPPAARKEIWFYGRNNLVGTVVMTLQTNLDNFAVGSFIGRAVLGIYSTGYRLAMTPREFIQPISQRLLVPIYRTAHDESAETLISNWRMGFRIVTLGYTLLSATAILLADWGVSILFGPKWAGMGYVIAFATVIAFFRGMTASLSPLLLILRAPHWETRFKFVELFVFGVFIAAGSVTGRIGLMLFAGVASYFVGFVLRWEWWRRQLVTLAPGARLGGELKQMIAAVAMLLAAELARSFGINPLMGVVAVCAIVAIPVARSYRTIQW